MASIRENLVSSLDSLHVPDCCNLGTWLRVLLAVNGAALAVAFIAARQPAALPAGFVGYAAYVEPICFGTLIVLCVGRRWLTRLKPMVQAALVVVAALAVTTATVTLLAPIDDGDLPMWRAWLMAFAVVTVLMAWFDLAARAFAPAVAEARLMALTARIRPHFLFNSLNGVLGVIRSDPRRAETALEELSELFRALMQDNRDLVPLSSEIALCRQYLDLERLRLGDRLQVRWNIESCPVDAMVPPLMLQPLIENAVYHGIEPLSEPGEIEVSVSRRHDRMAIAIANPCAGDGESSRHAGNHMALANIRERLALFFDLEATLQTEVAGGRHFVNIELPYRRGVAQ